MLGVQGGQREAVLSRLGESTAGLLCPQNAPGVFPLKGPARSEMQPQCEERVWSWGGLLSPPKLTSPGCEVGVLESPLTRPLMEWSRTKTR